MQKTLAISALALLSAGAAWFAVRRVHQPSPPASVPASGPGAVRVSRSARPVHPFSVVPGGVYGGDEVQDWTRLDPVVARHYGGIAASELRTVRVAVNRRAYVSYRRGDMVFWTPHPVTLKVGETLLTDGVNEIRARCGNRISDTLRGPSEALGIAPKESVLDETLPPALARAEFSQERTPEWLIAAVQDPSQQASRDAVALAGGGSTANSDSFGGGAMVFVGGGGGLGALPSNGSGTSGTPESPSGTPPEHGRGDEPGGSSTTGATGSSGASGSTGATGATGPLLAGSIPQPGLTPNPWLPPPRDSITEGGGGSTGSTSSSGSTGTTVSTGTTGSGGRGSTGATGYSGGTGFTALTGFTGITGGSGGFTGPTSTIQAVPEPATFLLVGSVLIALGLVRKLTRR